MKLEEVRDVSTASHVVIEALVLRDETEAAAQLPVAGGVAPVDADAP